jgi:hypothetical protein
LCSPGLWHAIDISKCRKRNEGGWRITSGTRILVIDMVTHGYTLTNVKHETSERRAEHRSSPYARAAERIHGHRHRTDRNRGRAPQSRFWRWELVWLLKPAGPTHAQVATRSSCCASWTSTMKTNCASCRRTVRDCLRLGCALTKGVGSGAGRTRRLEEWPGCPM